MHIQMKNKPSKCPVDANLANLMRRSVDDKTGRMCLEDKPFCRMSDILTEERYNQIFKGNNNTE